MKNTFKKIMKIFLPTAIIIFVFVVSFIFINNKLSLKTEAENISASSAQSMIMNAKIENNPVTAYDKVIKKILGNKSNTSNTSNYPYYYGVGAKGLTPLQVSMLTKDFKENTPSFTTAVSPVSEVWYFAYPDSYPPLKSIKDQNGFELISDFKVTTGNDIINLSGDKKTYRIYEYINTTTLSSYKVTYMQ